MWSIWLLPTSPHKYHSSSLFIPSPTILIQPLFPPSDLDVFGHGRAWWGLEGKKGTFLWPCLCSVLNIPLPSCNGLLLCSPTWPSDLLGLMENSSQWTVTVRGMEMGTTIISGRSGVRFAPEISGNWSAHLLVFRRSYMGADVVASPGLNFDPYGKRG